MDSKGTKIRLEKGISITVPVYSIHRDTNFYPDPEKFNPDRFNPEFGGIKEFRDKCVLMPFGDGKQSIILNNTRFFLESDFFFLLTGPRICLGLRYGNLMVKYFLTEILKNFEVSLHEKTIEPFELEPTRLLTVPKNVIYFKFKKLV